MAYQTLTRKNYLTTHSIAIKYGLWMFVCFVSFFLLLYAFGLGHRSELRVFNGAIQIFFMYWAIKDFYTHHPEKINNYLLGVVEGMKASAVGIVGFTIFMSIFLTFNPVLMDTIKLNSSMEEYLNPITANLFLLTEGLVVSLIVSYIITRIMGLYIHSN